jgi:hypothetical protein
VSAGESFTRETVRDRSGGRCEIPVIIEETDLGRLRRWRERCPGQLEEMSHRLAASKLGAWSPVNILSTCWPCHRWLHAEPAAAFAGGWHVPAESDPGAVPVWLLDPWPGWWLLADLGDGGPHVLRVVEPRAGPEVFRVVKPVSWAA